MANEEMGMEILPPVRQNVLPHEQFGGKFVPIPKIDITPDSAAGDLKDVTKTKEAFIAETRHAQELNTQEQTEYLNRQEGYDATANQTFDNINRVLRWGGPNAVTNAISLFNPAWNLRVQENQLTTVQAKKQADAVSTDIRMKINAQKPLLKQLDVQAAELKTEAYKQQIELGTLATGYNQQLLNLDRTVAELDAARTTAQTNKIKSAVEGMGLGQRKAALAQARNGKGPWVGLEGYLEHSIVQEEQINTALRLSLQAAAKGDLEALDTQQKFIASRLTPEVAEAAIAQARANNLPYASFGEGENKIDIPINIIIAEQEAIGKRQKAYEVERLTDNVSRAQESLQRSSSILSAFAGQNKTAASELATAKQFEGLDYKDPNNVRLLQGYTTVLDGKTKEVIDQVKASYGPEGQTAIENFAKNGQFDGVGAVAVVTDVLGKPGVTAQSDFPQVWANISKTIQDRLNMKQLGGMGQLLVGNKGPISATTALAAAFARGDTTQLKDMIKETMADPTLRDVNAKIIASSINDKTMQGVLANLVAGNQANQVWFQAQQMYNGGKFSVLKDGKIVFDLPQMTDWLEQQTQLTKYEVDYNKILTDAFRQKLVNTSDQFLADPSRQLYDRAVMTATYGDNPTRAVLSGTVTKMEQERARIRQTKWDQLQEDLSGKTSQRAALRASAQSITQDPGATGVDIPIQAAAQAPSSGIKGKSAVEIQQLYGITPPLPIMESMPKPNSTTRSSGRYRAPSTGGNF